MEAFGSKHSQVSVTYVHSASPHSGLAVTPFLRLNFLTASQSRTRERKI